MKPELVSPAGNLDRLRFAVEFGADAVYMGGKHFNLRAFADNFDFDEMAEGIEYAHSRGKKVYITVNAFLRNGDLPELREFVKTVREMKPDSFVVSELGALSVVKETAPDIDVHISTQANVTNVEAVKMFRKLGAKRIILARELSLEEIEEIKSNAEDTEIEVFVHGAMCMAYSGRCFLSDYLTGRSGNRGECSQCCRWKYYIVEEKRLGELFEVEENGRGAYILNSKDLCALPVLDRLLETKVDALKIEGRNKSIYYVAVTTGIYRKAIDLLKEKGKDAFLKELPFLLEEIDKVSHRPYTTGFLTGEKNLQNPQDSRYVRNYEFLGFYNGREWEIRGTFEVGTRVEIFYPSAEVEETTVVSIKLVKDGKISISSTAHPNQKALLSFDGNVNVTEFCILRTKR